MPPRKSRIQSESEGDDDEYEFKPDLNKASSSKRSKDGDEEEENSEPKSKKSKSKASSGGDGEVVIEENDQGESYLKLSEYRRLTVRTFKGKVLVDIREMYKDKNTGEMKPGTKGLALTKEQWDLIRNNMNNVDDMIAKVNEK